ncbi:MAG: hypothetical protein PVI57_09535 [Gemmatimonadota bacterium]|jgi:hypothetical protein
MKARTGHVLGASSVAIVAVVGLSATSLSTADSKVWLYFCVALAGATAFQSVASEPRDLMPALLFSLPPVMALAAEGSPTWLIGPFGVLLLLAAELSALSWEFQGEGPPAPVTIRRLGRIAPLVALALAASVTVYIASWAPVLRGTPAFMLAAAALAGIGWVVFGRSA